MTKIAKSTKQELRQEIKRRLDAVPLDVYLAQAAVTYEHVRGYLARLEDQRTVHAVLSYQASKRWREVDVFPLEADFPKLRFDYVPADPNASYPSEQYDVVLVPLYGFTTDGYRLGHGTGWYDRFLAMQPQAHSIGVGLEESLLSFTAEPHDVPLDSIITDKRTGSYRERLLYTRIRS